MSKPLIFISYSHKDEREKDHLLRHLGVVQEAGLLELWSDDRLDPGSDWKEEIDEAVGVLEGFYGGFEGRDGGAANAEDVEEFVPECLRFRALPSGLGPIAREGDGPLSDLIPGEWQ